MATEDAVEEASGSYVVKGTEPMREVLKEAVISLSGAKPGNGVEQLLDDDLETFWQSDGLHPHTIDVQFHRKTSVMQVSLYFDFRHDESYTPRRINIRAGNTTHELHDVKAIQLHEPVGWVNVTLGDGPRYLRTRVLQVAILSMHQNGRDTHVRQLKVFSPKSSTTSARFLPEFSTVAMSKFSTAR